MDEEETETRTVVVSGSVQTVLLKHPRQMSEETVKECLDLDKHNVKKYFPINAEESLLTVSSFSDQGKS